MRATRWERLRALDERILTGGVRTPPPWSPPAGPLVPLAAQLRQGRLLGAVATPVGLSTALLHAVASGVHPADALGAAVTFLLGATLFALIVGNTSRQRALLDAAREAPQSAVRAQVVPPLVTAAVGLARPRSAAWRLRGGLYRTPTRPG